jgi:threonine dehydratase
LTRALEANAPVTLDTLTSAVQGLCPPRAGVLNTAICALTLNGVLLVDDEDVFASQATLRGAGEIVEPAGAAAHAALPLVPRAGSDSRRSIRRIAIVLSGANA